ncbi:MAG: toll/interleukin-1 receptor domain-containing protein [Flavobacteriales bacterium]|nr:toll/interleukin-1 receptor domain-containing protein [Flavobacteriales bacterium]
MTARSRVFISYRRAETDGAARLIYNYLTEKLGKSAVFMDIKGIAPGDVFRKTIAHELETCNTMIVVVSKSWTGKTEVDGRSRLHEEGDFVRMEIETALGRDIRVIPVLVHPMKMPHKDDLPEKLQYLTSIQHQEIQLGQRFEDDMARVVKVIRPADLNSRIRRMLVPIALGVATLIAAAFWSVNQNSDREVLSVTCSRWDSADSTAVKEPVQDTKTSKSDDVPLPKTVRNNPSPCALEGLDFISDGSLEDRLTLAGESGNTIFISGELNRKPVNGKLLVNGGVLTVATENGTWVNGRLELAGLQHAQRVAHVAQSFRRKNS